MPKGTLGMTGLHEISGRDKGIEEPYLGYVRNISPLLNASFLLVHG